MPDEQSGGPEHEVVEDQPDYAPEEQEEPVAAPSAVRRTRPAPSATYVRGRPARREEPSGINPLIVPIFAVVAVVALIGAIVFDRVHNNTNSAAPAPTAFPTTAPSPTPAPTATPVPVPVEHSTNPTLAAVVNGVKVPLDLFTILHKVNVTTMQQSHQDPTTGATTPPVDMRTKAGLKQLYQKDQTDLSNLLDTAAAIAYAQKHHLVADKAQVTQQLNTIYSQNGGKAAFLKAVEADGYTEAAVNTIIANQTTENDVFKVIGPKAPCPCTRHVRHILIGNPADANGQSKPPTAAQKALAYKVAKELQADHGSNFAALAKKYSIDTASKAQGGDLGMVQPGQTVPPFDKAVFSLKIGQISNPVLSTYGYHIIEVLGDGPPSSTQQQTYFTNWLKQQRTKGSQQIYVQIPKS